MTQPKPMTDPDDRVMVAARAMYDAWPMKAISPAMAERAGVPLNTPLTWEQTLAIGGDHSGLIRLATAAAAALSTDDAVTEELRAFADELHNPNERALVLKAVELLAMRSAALPRQDEGALSAKESQDSRV